MIDVGTNDDHTRPNAPTSPSLSFPPDATTTVASYY